MIRRLGLSLLAAGSLGSAAALTEVPVDESFVYDGTSSDLAQQFYRLYEAGKSVAQYDFVTTDLPAEVQARLTSEDLAFEELPGLLQRSLLWDSGYTLDSENSFIKVYTVQGVSMGEIAVSLDDYLSAGCTTKNCTDPDGTETFRSETCSGSMMLSVSHCASEQVSKKGGHTSMWATGGDPEDGAPELNMVRHAWYDNVYFQNYIVFAIHTMSNDAEPAWDTCTSGSQYGSIIIPCGIYAEDQAEALGWETPAQGALTAAWLKRYKEDQPPPFNMLLLLPIAIAFVMLCTGLYMYCRWHRRRSLTKDTFGLTTTPRSPADHDHAGPAVQVKSSAFLESGVAIQWSFGYPSSSSGLVRALITDPQLREKRIPMDRLVFDREVAKGAFGEVWLCEYDGEVVAVKRLLRNRKHTFDDMQIFMDEIQLTATLDHPNILRFIGVAWNILENLSMVMEYLPNGDLQSYLRKNSEKLTWAVDKHGLAVGIARAIAYLHARKPLLIHRDVKAKNVLLTEEYEAKVIDFGVSRPYGDHSMTVGVGTPFWTAPEVLDGSVYSEKSDIYSFGVVLSELDTGAAPYYDAKTATHGSTLQPFHILKLVMAGCLHPNFSGTCPPRIRQIAELCLQRDPDSRPSAQRVVELLEGVSDIELLEVVGQRDKTDGVRCDAIDEEGKTHSPRSSEPDEGDADSEENPYHEMG